MNEELKLKDYVVHFYELGMVEVKGAVSLSDAIAKACTLVNELWGKEIGAGEFGPATPEGIISIYDAEFAG